MNTRTSVSMLALSQFGNSNATPTTAQPPPGVEPTGLSSGHPSFPVPSGRPHGPGDHHPGLRPSGTIPSGVPSGLTSGGPHPSGGLGEPGGGSIPSGVPSGFPTGGFVGFAQDGLVELCHRPCRRTNTVCWCNPRPGG